MLPVLSSLLSLSIVPLALAASTSTSASSSASFTTSISVASASASASASVPQIQSPFKIVNTGRHDPGQNHQLYPEYLYFKVYDPVTKTSTGCNVNRLYNGGNAYPGNWTHCVDTTFSFKVDSFTYYGPAWGLEIKHQYKGKGKKCGSTTASDCTTARAYVYVDKNTTPGYRASSGGFSSTEFFAGPVYANVFSKCDSGCGLYTGDY